MLKRLTKNDIDKIQIDEGIVVVNYKETDQKILGPTRGGVECTITPSIRDIEFDGRRGKTKGLQVKDGEDAELKVSTLCCSLENLKFALRGTTSSTTSIEQNEESGFGLIKDEEYVKNVAVVTMMLDGTFKVLIIKNAMHEGAFSFKANSKAENEHALDFFAHYDPINGGSIWKIEDEATNPLVTK